MEVQFEERIGLRGMRFIVDKRMNLFCHFMICSDIHRYLKNRYYRQEGYSLYSEGVYRFFRDELPIYCLEFLLKAVSDYPNFDMSRLKQSLDSYLFSFLDKEAEVYEKYWSKREIQLLALKQHLEELWSPMEEKLQFSVQYLMGEKPKFEALRVFLIDAFYGRKEGEGESSTAEVNMVDENLLLVCACEPGEVLRIIIHEIVHRPLNKIISRLHVEMELNEEETTIISETFARLIEKEVCDKIGVQSMTEEETRQNTERFGFLNFYLKAASAWQGYIKDSPRTSLADFMRFQVERNRGVLKKCSYSSSFL